jgi:hypothetical protein
MRENLLDDAGRDRFKTVARAGEEPHRPLVWRILAWLVSGGAVLGGLLALDLRWNLFAWRPEWSLAAAGSLAVCAAGACGLIALARGCAGNVEPRLALAVAAALTIAALRAAPAEPRSHKVLMREAPSPLWYRGSRSALLMSLAAVSVAGAWRGRKRSVLRDQAR